MVYVFFRTFCHYWIIAPLYSLNHLVITINNDGGITGMKKPFVRDCYLIIWSDDRLLHKYWSDVSHLSCCSVCTACMYEKCSMLLRRLHGTVKKHVTKRHITKINAMKLHVTKAYGMRGRPQITTKAHMTKRMSGRCVLRERLDTTKAHATRKTSHYNESALYENNCIGLRKRMTRAWKW